VYAQTNNKQTNASTIVEMLLNLQPVFAAMLEKAVRICDATFGNIYRWDGDAL
jgi:hypothetical protein